MKFRIHHTSSGGGVWSPDKPNWDMSQYDGFYTTIENDGRTTMEVNNLDQREKMYWWDMYIEIRTIHDLLRLSEKFGEIIINAKDKSIEIYDDYRE